MSKTAQMTDLDDRNAIQQIDQRPMLPLLQGFPTQCQEAVELGQAVEISGSLTGAEQVLFAGMGGSAMGGDLIRSYAASIATVPMAVNRGYELPEWVGESTLFIACSYSGNTEETLSAYEAAKTRTRKLLVISSGGELLSRAQADGVSSIRIPGGLPPRCALGYGTMPLLVALGRLGVLPDQTEALEEAIGIMQSLGERVAPDRPLSDNAAKQLATELIDRMPVLYAAHDRTDAVAVRWRSQLAENSKVLASHHLFPELNHNEIVGWEYPTPVLQLCRVVILQDSGDHLRVRRRMEITQQLLEEAGVSVITVQSEGSGLLARMFSLIVLGDFTSYYLALLNQRDPSPVERIDHLKRSLAEGA